MFTPSLVRLTSDSADHQESDNETLTSERPWEIKKKKKRTKKETDKKIFLCFCLWVFSIATTTYGHQAVASLSKRTSEPHSDVRLIVQYFPRRKLAGLFREGLTSL